MHTLWRDLSYGWQQLKGSPGASLIAVLSSEPSLQQSRHVYECPMAKGYKKWVQVSEGVSNPYMGSAMPQCGVEADF